MIDNSKQSVQAVFNRLANAVADVIGHEDTPSEIRQILVEASDAIIQQTGAMSDQFYQRLGLLRASEIITSRRDHKDDELDDEAA
jgi:hypothetical protein